MPLARPKLSELRRIAWRCWDPIGLAPPQPGYDDEYDAYLYELLTLLNGGAGAEEAAHYLMDIEADHMGLGPRADAVGRAQATVAAVQDYLATLKD